MKKLAIVLLMTFMNFLTYGQALMEDYVKSYPPFEARGIVESYELYNKHVKMTKEEALTFVVNGDTSKLYCPNLEYDGWDEKIYGMSISEYMPEKCVRVDYENYSLICFEYTECDSNGVRPKSVLIFELIDKNYIKRDSLVVYKRDDYEVYLQGLYNSQTQKIYLYNTPESGDIWYSIIYRINSKSLKFEVLRRYDGKVNAKVNKQIEALGWEEVFYSDDCENEQ